MSPRAVAALVGALAVSTATAALSGDVTLNAERASQNSVRFSGAITSGAANEYVALLLQKCGEAFSTAVAGTTTDDRGLWVLEIVSGSGTFRAKWNHSLSDPVKVRMPVRFYVSHARGGRHTVYVFASSNLMGRFVELQRLAAGRWVRVRRLRLEGASANEFLARFIVRTRGLRLRVAVPAKTAAPCDLPAASAMFVS